MITVEASTIVDLCSAKTPMELATPIENTEVVMDPAAENPAPAAFRQITPTLLARCAGVHS